MPDLTVGDQLLHCPGDVLDRNVRVDAVLVEQVNPVGPQSRERRIGYLPNVLWAAVESATLAGDRVDVECELGRYDDVIADRGEGLADEFLVSERPVGFGGVEEGDALVRRHADEGACPLADRSWCSGPCTRALGRRPPGRWHRGSGFHRAYSFTCSSGWGSNHSPGGKSVEAARSAWASKLATRSLRTSMVVCCPTWWRGTSSCRGRRPVLRR
jgi:hypothetical protein